jgi:ribosomal protein L35AE/L33A
MQSEEITELQDAILAIHGCESRWEASVKVEEKFQDKTAWSGIVEVFALVDHPKAKYAYAWTYRDGDQNKTTVILKILPVDSPQTAVKIAIASKARK